MCGTSDRRPTDADLFFSMIFAHGPIILPSITGFAMPFQQLFYGHLVLLHLSLLLRIAGDLAESSPLRQWAGLSTLSPFFSFLANNVRAVRRGENRLFRSKNNW